MKMNLDEVDEAPMVAFNKIIWKSVRARIRTMPRLRCIAIGLRVWRVIRAGTGNGLGDEVAWSN